MSCHHKKHEKEEFGLTVGSSRTAQLFSPGVISNGHAYGISFSRDMSTAYFTYQEEDSTKAFIYQSQWKDDSWTEPVISSFSGRYEEFDPNLSPDHKYMFIMTSRPEEGTVQKDHFDIWYMKNDGTQWSNPQPLGPGVNTPANEGVVAMTNDNKIYYFSTKEDGYGGGDIYQAHFENGQVSEVRNVGAPINTEHWEGHNCLSPDGKVMVFYSNKPETSLGSGDLYVTYHVNGKWTDPENLGPSVNSEIQEITPSFSPDMKYLFFGRIHAPRSEDDQEDRRSIWYIPIKDTIIKL